MYKAFVKFVFVCVSMFFASCDSDSSTSPTESSSSLESSSSIIGNASSASIQNSSSSEALSSSSITYVSISLKELMSLAGYTANCMDVNRRSSNTYRIYGYEPEIECSEIGWVDDPEGVFQALLENFGLDVTVELMKRTNRDYTPVSMQIDSTQVINVLKGFFEE